MFKRLKPVVFIEILIHLLLWVFITVTPIMTRPYSGIPQQLLFRPWHIVLLNVLLAAQFYLNAFFLIPVILNKQQKVVLYFSLLFLSIIFINILLDFAQPQIPLVKPDEKFALPPGPGFGYGLNFFPVIVVTAASFAYRYLADLFHSINNKRDIDNAALVSELAFLRSQISPHFIFNVINSVVALSRLNPAAVEPTLIQLSQLLRYMLYVGDEDKITLVRKADYLRSYIELQKLRFQDLVKVKLNLDIAEPKKAIEPMLLIPFVENAFKHGTANSIGNIIEIDLKSDAETLNFSVWNNFEPDGQNNDEHHGIGLSNVKRRLELLYPGKHKLSIRQTHNVYKINLQIQLK